MNKLYPHQVEAVRRALNRPFFGLFMEQGTGKTPTAIRVIEKWYRKAYLHRWLVVAPNHLLYNWAREWEEWGRLDKVRIVRLRGRNKKQWIQELEDLRSSDLDFVPKKKLQSRSRDGQPLTVLLLNFEKVSILEPQLRRLKFQGLVVDESQRLKNRNAQVSKAVYRVTRGCSSRVLLSGTPNPQGLEDLFMQFQIMDPDILGTRWGSFADRYIRKGGYMGKQIVGYRNEEELRSIVGEHSYRVLLGDCIDLPPLHYKYLSCELTGAASKAYSDLYEELYTRIAGDGSRSRLKAVLRANHIPYRPGDSYLSLFTAAEPFLNVASCELTVIQRLRLHQLTGGFLTLDSGEVVQLSTDKFKTLVDYLRGRTRPTVVFCQYIPEIHMLETELKKAFPKRRIENYRDSTDRGRLQDDFSSGRVDVILLQLHSGSLGLNFQAADALVFYSLNNSTEDFTQAMARIRRPGQNHNMEVAFILAEETVDEDILANVQRKAENMENFWKI